MKKGFTLVELLIVIGLVLILGTFGTSVIVSILRSYNKAHIINEIEQNGNYVLSVMETQIRNARSVAESESSCNIGRTKCLILTVTPQTGTAFNFEIERRSVVSGGTTYYYGVVEKGGEAISDDDDTTGVDVMTDATADTSPSYFNVDGNTVKIFFRIRQAPLAPGRVDYQAETTLQTTVVVRGGYE
jgi:prepilin-type N-terminal cleavage/methylation domain-containing protein